MLVRIRPLGRDRSPNSKRQRSKVLKFRIPLTRTVPTINTSQVPSRNPTQRVKIMTFILLVLMVEDQPWKTRSRPKVLINLRTGTPSKIGRPTITVNPSEWVSWIRSKTNKKVSFRNRCNLASKAWCRSRSESCLYKWKKIKSYRNTKNSWTSMKTIVTSTLTTKFAKSNRFRPSEIKGIRRSRGSSSSEPKSSTAFAPVPKNLMRRYYKLRKKSIPPMRTTWLGSSKIELRRQARSIVLRARYKSLIRHLSKETPAKINYHPELKFSRLWRNSKMPRNSMNNKRLIGFIRKC